MHFSSADYSGHWGQCDEISVDWDAILPTQETAISYQSIPQLDLAANAGDEN